MLESKGNNTVQLIPSPDGIFYHEDMVPGASATYGDLTVTRDAIIAFATAYDPQPIHLDEAAAKASIVGGLCASGFHTCALMMRLLCDHFLLRSTSLGSPGLDEVKWLQPVRPDDHLAVRISILETRDLQSRPEVGISKMRFELLDAAKRPVLEAITNQLMRRRHPGHAVTADRPARSAPAPLASLWDEPAITTVVDTGNYFEDIVVGENRALGGHTFGHGEIIAFAAAFDPQPFHLDEAAGKQSLFGGLAASGWHTAAIFIRHVVEARQQHERHLSAARRPLAQWGPSPGFRTLSWPRPVLMGDHIDYRNKVIEKRELKSRPTRGLIVSQGEGRNQHGEVVYRITSQIFVERRASA